MILTNQHQANNLKALNAGLKAKPTLDAQPAIKTPATEFKAVDGTVPMGQLRNTPAKPFLSLQQMHALTQIHFGAQQSMQEMLVPKLETLNQAGGLTRKVSPYEVLAALLITPENERTVDHLMKRYPHSLRPHVYAVLQEGQKHNSPLFTGTQLPGRFIDSIDAQGRITLTQTYLNQVKSEDVPTTLVEKINQRHVIPPADVTAYQTGIRALLRTPIGEGDTTNTYASVAKYFTNPHGFVPDDGFVEHFGSEYALMADALVDMVHWGILLPVVGESNDLKPHADFLGRISQAPLDYRDDDDHIQFVVNPQVLPLLREVLAGTSPEQTGATSNHRGQTAIVLAAKAETAGTKSFWERLWAGEFWRSNASTLGQPSQGSMPDTTWATLPFTEAPQFYYLFKVAGLKNRVVPDITRGKSVDHPRLPVSSTNPALTDVDMPVLNGLAQHWLEQLQPVLTPEGALPFEHAQTISSVSVRRVLTPIIPRWHHSDFESGKIYYAASPAYAYQFTLEPSHKTYTITQYRQTFEGGGNPPRPTLEIKETLPDLAETKLTFTWNPDKAQTTNQSRSLYIRLEGKTLYPSNTKPDYTIEITRPLDAALNGLPNENLKGAFLQPGVEHTADALEDLYNTVMRWLETQPAEDSQETDYQEKTKAQLGAFTALLTQLQEHPENFNPHPVSREVRSGRPPQAHQQTGYQFEAPDGQTIEIMRQYNKNGTEDPTQHTVDFYIRLFRRGEEQNLENNALIIHVKPRPRTLNYVIGFANPALTDDPGMPVQESTIDTRSDWDNAESSNSDCWFTSKALLPVIKKVYHLSQGILRAPIQQQLMGLNQEFEAALAENRYIDMSPVDYHFNQYGITLSDGRLLRLQKNLASRNPDTYKMTVQVAASAKHSSYELSMSISPPQPGASKKQQQSYQIVMTSPQAREKEERYLIPQDTWNTPENASQDPETSDNWLLTPETITALKTMFTGSNDLHHALSKTFSS